MNRLIFCLCFLVACTPTPDLSRLRHAWYVCEQFVQMNYGISSDRAGRYDAKGVTQDGDLFVAGVYYPVIGQVYTCTMSIRDNGDWVLLNLDP